MTNTSIYFVSYVKLLWLFHFYVTPKSKSYDSHKMFHLHCSHWTTWLMLCNDITIDIAAQNLLMLTFKEGLAEGESRYCSLKVKQKKHSPTTCLCLGWALEQTKLEVFTLYSITVSCLVLHLSILWDLSNSFCYTLLLYLSAILSLLNSGLKSDWLSCYIQKLPKYWSIWIDHHTA